MKKCNQCGAFFPEESAFCPECGSTSASVSFEGGRQQGSFNDMPKTVPYYGNSEEDEQRTVALGFDPSMQQPQQPVGQSGSFGGGYPQSQQPAGQNVSYGGGYPQSAQPAQNTDSGDFRQSVQQSVQNAGFGGYQQPKPPVQQPVYDPGMQRSATPPAEPPKKKNTGLIVGIVAVVVVLLGILLWVIFGGKGNDKDDNDTTAKSSFFDDDEEEKTTKEEKTTEEPTTKKQTVNFTVGKIRDGWYYNEWAGLQFKIPDGYVHNKEEADDIDSEFEKVGLYAETEEGERFMVEFYLNYKLAVDSSVETAEDILDYLMDIFEDSENFENFERSDYTKKTVAGQSYSMVCFSVPDTNVELRVLVRLIDKHAVVLVLSGYADENESILNSIAPYTGVPDEEPTEAEEDAEDAEDATMEIG